MNTQKHVFYGAEGRYVAEVDFDRVTAERDALQQLLNARDEEVDRLRYEIEEWNRIFDMQEGKIDAIRAQLAEAQALLQAVREARRVAHHYHSGNGMLDWIEGEAKRLSASAEPSAPKCGPGNPCAYPVSCGCQSAPVEIDERAEFEAWGADQGYFNLKREHSGKYKFQTAWAAWEGWQARAALDRKP